MHRWIAPLVTSTFSLALTASAFASGKGQPDPWQLGYQEAVTDVAADLHSLSSGLHWVAALITIFVTILLGYVCWKFSAKRNPVADRFSHNTVVEVVWTVVPVLILVGMAYPSIKLLYKQETVPPADLTVKAIGNQWNWQYMYDIDGEPVYIDSMMAGHGYANYDDMVEGMKGEGASDEEIPSRELWKLQATAPMVVPVNAIVRVQVTASDVLHAWTVPSFGVKVDAVPGRLNETWFQATEPGMYYGQCSELCGRDHSFMPIMVEVVSEEDFPARLQGIKEEWASRDVPAEIMVAANSPLVGE